MSALGRHEQRRDPAVDSTLPPSIRAAGVAHIVSILSPGGGEHRQVLDSYQPPEQPQGKINLTDLDSRNVKTLPGWVQGYNAQAVCTEDQIVIAAEVTPSSAVLWSWSRRTPRNARASGRAGRAGSTR